MHDEACRAPKESEAATRAVGAPAHKSIEAIVKKQTTVSEDLRNLERIPTYLISDSQGYYKYITHNIFINEL